MNSPLNDKKHTTLPAKYNNALLFGYWLINEMKSHDKISCEIYEEYMTIFHIFDGVNSQIEFLNTFFEDFKIVKKNLKKEVREKQKMDKQKERKEVKEFTTKKRRGRKVKEIIDTRSDEEILVDKILAECQKKWDEEEKQMNCLND